MNVLEKILEEIENFNYHPEGMGCGIEDRGITDRYEACEYGWNEAIESVIEIINNMREAISEMETVKKEKVTSAEIISREIDGIPYYEIKFKKVGEDEYTIGYGSYKFDYVVKWLNDCYEFVGEAKVFCENDNWIPVSERLPEVGKMVKVTVHSSEWIADYDSDWVPEEEKTYHPEEYNVYDGYIDRVGMWRFYDEEGSVNACDKEFGTNKGIVYDVVTAWMPKEQPEPYKEK